MEDGKTFFFFGFLLLWPDEDAGRVWAGPPIEGLRRRGFGSWLPPAGRATERLMEPAEVASETGWSMPIEGCRPETAPSVCWRPVPATSPRPVCPRGQRDSTVSRISSASWPPYDAPPRSVTTLKASDPNTALKTHLPLSSYTCPSRCPTPAQSHLAAHPQPRAGAGCGSPPGGAAGRR